MPISKQEKLDVVAAERLRIEHGLFAAEVDVRVSLSTPDNTSRLQAAEAALKDVHDRLAVCDAIAEEIKAEPDPEPAPE